MKIKSKTNISNINKNKWATIIIINNYDNNNKKLLKIMINN